MIICLINSVVTTFVIPEQSRHYDFINPIEG